MADSHAHAAAHGPADTRHRRGGDRDGLGQGVLRLYAAADGTVAGYSWSTLRASEVHRQGGRDLVIGRYAPDRR